MHIHFCPTSCNSGIVSLGNNHKCKKDFVHKDVRYTVVCYCSAAQSWPTLWPHGLQHARLSCLSLSPRVCSNSCPLIQWCHPTISNHLILCHPLLLLPSIFPSIRVFANESALPSGGQNTGASALASVLPMNSQNLFPLGLTGLKRLRVAKAS